MNSFEELIKQIDAFIWGVPLLVLLLGAGIILTFKLTGFQVRQFGFAMKNTFGKMFDKSEYGEGTVTPFQALSTALAATVGTGNIVGVTVALLTGGPGAIFWMWVTAFVGIDLNFLILAGLVRLCHAVAVLFVIVVWHEIAIVRHIRSLLVKRGRRDLAAPDSIT